MVLLSWFVYWQPGLPSGVYVVVLGLPAQFYLGPLLYAYLIKSLRWKSFLIPGIVTVLFLIIWMFRFSALVFPPEIKTHLPLFHYTIADLAMVHNLVYLTLILRKGINRDEVFLIFLSLPVLIASQISYELCSKLGFMTLNLDYVFGFAVSILFFISGYLLLVKQRKYVNSQIPPSAMEDLLSETNAHMYEYQSYLNPDLTLNDLARELSMQPRKLSQVINQGFNKSFSDFVNEFRVEKSKELLKSLTDERTTVQEVMYQSGFNSKSTFNLAFKRLTGTTPMKFRNQYSQEEVRMAEEGGGHIHNRAI
ncbi:MAG: helix-turn-helix domain-containing protein [Cyclobacteriaceae bacterium]